MIWYYSCVPYKNPEDIKKYYQRNREKIIARVKANHTHKRAERQEKWEKQYITCIEHVTRRCARTLYVVRGQRRCASCTSHKKDGSLRAAVARYAKSEQKYWKAKSAKLHRRIQENKI